MNRILRSKDDTRGHVPRFWPCLSEPRSRERSQGGSSRLGISPTNLEHQLIEKLKSNLSFGDFSL